MTTVSSKLFQGHVASSSSIEADYLSLSVDSVRSFAELVGQGLQLNERQCQDLSSKLVKIVENIQKLVPPSQASRVLFGPALKNLYRVLEKAKLLVHQCCATDWCRAAVFQIHNEGTFREALLEVGLCYNVIYELTKRILQDSEWTVVQAEDLRQSSLFLPASETKVLEDQEILKRKLEHVAGTSDDRNSYLARYLLRKLECVSAARMNEDLSVPDALLWMNETEPQGTWKLHRVLGSGSGAVCVCCYEWLGILCARKEFHCRVADVIFRKEAAILAQLNHPNIVKFFCCSNDPEMGKCYIAMELMEMSLDSLIESRAKARCSFPFLLVLDIMIQIARGVWYLHGLNIAHRDLKPLNVVVTETRSAHLEDFFCVKLVDFGMSKTKVQVSKSNTISIPGVGTTTYRAPEVFLQAQQVAPGLKRKVNWFLADAYSFGITCAVLLSLKKPFEDVPASKLYEQLLHGVRPELPGECPEALVSLLNDCWATDPRCRPGFSEICSRLEQCKLQEFLRVSSGGLQGDMGCEYVETVSMKQSHERSQGTTRVPHGHVHFQNASTVSFHSDASKEAVGISQFHEGGPEGNPSSDDYSKDRPSIFSSKFRQKEVGLWSRTMSNLARVIPTDALLFMRGSRFLQSKAKTETMEFEGEEFDVKPILFSNSALHSMTQDFHPNMILGDSGFGMVYKGVLPNGSVVVVKKVYSFCNIHDFLNTIVIFTHIKHKNLVTLKGCSHDHDKLGFLVYEDVENFDVSQILLRPRLQMVAWPVRFKICLGVAQGLDFLHVSRIIPGNIHRNINAQAVFLDKNFVPKIDYFQLGLMFPDEETNTLPDTGAGTMGYIAPELAMCGEVSNKTDVYSFGVLGLEIISGRRNYEETAPLDQRYILEWVQRLHKEDKLSELVDPTLHLTDAEARDVQQVIKLCLMCVQNEASRRPSMVRIVSVLRGETEWDEQVLW